MFDHSFRFESGATYIASLKMVNFDETRGEKMHWHKANYSWSLGKSANSPRDHATSEPSTCTSRGPNTNHQKTEK